MKYLGKNENTVCRISEHATNDSVLITGQSGSGKTTRMNLMEMDSAESGDTAVVLDIGRTHSEDQIYHPVREAYEKLADRTDAASEGLNIPLLPEENADEVSSDRLICANISAIASAVRLGTKQTGILRKTVFYVAEKREQFGDDIQAVEAGLEQQGTAGEETGEKMWQVLHSSIFGGGGFHTVPGRISIIDLSGIDMYMRKTAAEAVMSFLWHQKTAAHKENLTVYIDEVQNLDTGTGSMTERFLCEGRRFGISMVLATQTMEKFKSKIRATLEQAAIRLYFHPSWSETAKIARQISLTEQHAKKTGPEQRAQWEKRLNGLKTGECIAVGCMEANGVRINRPYLLR